jgi:hypothetical protein
VLKKTAYQKITLCGLFFLLKADEKTDAWRSRSKGFSLTARKIITPLDKVKFMRYNAKHIIHQARNDGLDI